MDHARVTLFAGHYGSGKTNIAVNYALALRREVQRVTIADLDTVNPYFRTKDSERELQAAGVSLICSDYANTNLDMPALPQSLYAILDDTQTSVVVDIGGDDRGAYALGRFAGGILQEHVYEMLLVVNPYRRLKLGEETTPEQVLRMTGFAEEVSALTGLPLRFTTVKESLYDALRGRIEPLMPLRLQKKII